MDKKIPGDVSHSDDNSGTTKDTSREKQERELDETLDDSFPASDPPPHG